MLSNPPPPPPVYNFAPPKHFRPKPEIIGFLPIERDLCHRKGRKKANNLTGNARVEQKIDNVIVFYASVLPYISIFDLLFLAVCLLSMFSGFLSVSRTLPVTQHLRNPDHFVVQLFIYKLNENYLQK